jgi:hypothetical protein
MKRFGLTLGVLLSLTGVALAAPGFPRTVQGTLEWPASLDGAPFIVVRTDDGRLVYVNVQEARRTAPDTVTAGSRISVVGVEGPQPHEVAAVRVGAGDSAMAGDAFSPSPSASIPTVETTTPATPAEDLWHLRGTVQSVSGSTLVLRTRDRATHTVDVSNLSQDIRASLRRGDEISLYGPQSKDRRLVATGFVQSETLPPAASPRTGR